MTMSSASAEFQGRPGGDAEPRALRDASGDAWPLLADATTHIHIKDAVFADGSVRPACEGEGQVPQLLATLAQRGYQGFVTLEPHLKIAGPSGGYSGAEGMRVAVRALRKLLAALPKVTLR